MNQTKFEAVLKRLLSNAAGLMYGSVSATVKVHDGRVVQVCYSTTENTRELAPFEASGPVAETRHGRGSPPEAVEDHSFRPTQGEINVKEN
jgi:hypothetical protein